MPGIWGKIIALAAVVALGYLAINAAFESARDAGRKECEAAYEKAKLGEVNRNRNIDARIDREIPFNADKPTAIEFLRRNAAGG